MSDKKINSVTPKFSENQKVTVKSREELIDILSEDQKSEGLLFMSQMFNYCGQKFKVVKIVKNIYMNKMIKPTASLYILEGLRCEGLSDSFSQRCDRLCNLVWHENWLN